jgi:hypothetical protein
MTKNGNRKTRIPSALASGLSAEKPEPALSSALGGDQKREAHRGRRAFIRITRRTTHLMDDDNLTESYKFLRDWLVHCGLIKGDAPHQLETEYRQEKVRHKKEVGTVVVLEYLEG